MQVEEFTKLLKRQPFEPFAVHLTDGSVYPVAHPDQIMLTHRAAYIGVGNGDADLVVQDVVICDLAHVACLGPVRRARRKPRKT